MAKMGQVETKNETLISLCEISRSPLFTGFLDKILLFKAGLVSPISVQKMGLASPIPSDPVGIQTQDLQNRKQTLKSPQKLLCLLGFR